MRSLPEAREGYTPWNWPWIEYSTGCGVRDYIQSRVYVNALQHKNLFGKGNHGPPHQGRNRADAAPHPDGRAPDVSAARHDRDHARTHRESRRRHTGRDLLALRQQESLVRGDAQPGLSA